MYVFITVRELFGNNWGVGGGEGQVFRRAKWGEQHEFHAEAGQVAAACWPQRTRQSAAGPPLACVSQEPSMGLVSHRQLNRLLHPFLYSFPLGCAQMFFLVYLLSPALRLVRGEWGHSLSPLPAAGH